MDGPAGSWPGGPIVIGVDRVAALPAAISDFDILLTTAPNAPRPWVSVSDIDPASGADPGDPGADARRLQPRRLGGADRRGS